MLRRRGVPASLAVVAGAITLALVGASSSSLAYVPGQDEPLPNPGALVHPEIPNAPDDALVPAESCAADPQRADCPPVTDVVVLPSSADSAAACIVGPGPDCIVPVDPPTVEEEVDPTAVGGPPVIVPYAPHVDPAQPIPDHSTAQAFALADVQAAADGDGDIPPGYACGLKPGEVLRSHFYQPTDFYVYAFTNHKCKRFVGVSYQEAGSTLARWNKGERRYVSLATDYANKSGGGSLRELYVGYNCNHDSVRTYRNDAYGYSVVRGRGYYQPDARYENWTC